MIVADTNVVSYLLINGIYSKEAGRIIEKDSDWVVPPLFFSEFRNVLSIYLRHRDMQLSESYAIMRQAELLMKGNIVEVQSVPILSLIAASNCSAYDCEFVALAHQLRVPLVTYDKKILREFPETAVSPQKFLA